MSKENKDCYLAINNKKHGPYSESDLQALFDKGKITEDTLFARKGMKEWAPLSESGILKDEDGIPILPDSVGEDDDEEEEYESAWVRFFGDSVIAKIVAFFIIYAIVHGVIHTIWSLFFG